ncbi:hypothetical protein C900_05038 [Fulvivirga imtechensis AK7]|uniref:Uncharacterized protein n=1 Tax=Fulvivirga imtechensis AK7 TaxID=1237149 RepID=L8JKP8_9BACT|nr:hypothetical protein [Fulvivirga imtechensis]ELR69506.1 hypothetical protein C900_05038 [Fulvivirga imtechensis AK7]
MMMYLNRECPTAMEFTSFSKVADVTDEDFIATAMQFEENYLKKQVGVVSHFLLRNLKGEYANLLFAKDREALKAVEQGFKNDPYARHYMQQISGSSVTVYYHSILKKNFLVPEHFSCFEHGIFKVKKEEKYSQRYILDISQKLEDQYLDLQDNTLEHFIGMLDEDTYSEIVFGKTLGKTREVCFGYLQEPIGLELMDIMIPDTAILDFWYLIA